MIRLILVFLGTFLVSPMALATPAESTENSEFAAVTSLAQWCGQASFPGPRASTSSRQHTLICIKKETFTEVGAGGEISVDWKVEVHWPEKPESPEVFDALFAENFDNLDRNSNTQGRRVYLQNSRGGTSLMLEFEYSTILADIAVIDDGVMNGWAQMKINNAEVKITNEQGQSARGHLGTLELEGLSVCGIARNEEGILDWQSPKNDCIRKHRRTPRPR